MQQRLQFRLFVLLSNIVGFPILRISLACDLERFCEYCFTVGRLLSFDGVVDGEDVLDSQKCVLPNSPLILCIRYTKPHYLESQYPYSEVRT